MSAPLEKAALIRLKEVTAGGADRPPVVRPDDDGALPARLSVQFNPTSLKISRQNSVDEGGTTTQTQRRQTPSQRPATLSFDLEYDTAEGDDSGAPKDVRELTSAVRQFVEPRKDRPGEPAPRVRFIWGRFLFNGIVTQVTEELDYFDPDGTALRAKVSLTITEQDLDFEGQAAGPGARDASSAVPPGGARAGTGPGAGPTANPVRAATAQAGESVQQLLSRVDVDPATWRTAMAGLNSPLTLAAGAQVQLGAQVSAGAGIGVFAGFAAGARVSATASLAGALGISAGASAGFGAAAGLGVSAGLGAGGSAGLSASAGASAVASGEVAAGFALAEAGGVAAAQNLVVTARAGAEVARARASFGVPGATRRLATEGDPRARGYGRSIPLGARAEATTVAAVAAGGALSLTARARAAEVVFGGTGRAPWQQLPASSAGRAAADAQQRRRDAGASTMRWTPGRW
jgi:hypothetical protein